MRKLIYFVAVTLDNFICHEDGSIDGFAAEGDHIPAFFERLVEFDTILMGRETYEFGYRYGMKPGDLAYPQAGLHNYVFSGTVGAIESDQLTVVRTDAAAAVRQLKRGVGRSIWLCGGGRLAGALLEAKLIDELWLKVAPIAFGRGRRLFGDSVAPFVADLHAARTFSSGVVFLDYALRY
jgi:dihydrofolate reductase